MKNQQNNDGVSEVYHIDNLNNSLVVRQFPSRDAVIGAAGTAGTLTNSYLFFDALQTGATEVIVNVSAVTVGASVVAQACSIGPLLEQYLHRHDISPKTIKAIGAVASFLAIGTEAAAMEVAAGRSVSLWSVGAATAGALLSHIFTGRQAKGRRQDLLEVQQYLREYQSRETERANERNTKRLALKDRLGDDPLAEVMSEWVGDYPVQRAPLEDSSVPNRRRRWGDRMRALQLRVELREEHGEGLDLNKLQAAIDSQPGLMSWDNHRYLVCQAFPEYADAIKTWANSARQQASRRYSL